MRKALVGVVLLIVLASAQRAEAQAAFGVRTGLTDDPESFFFGGHMAFHPQALRLFRIEPSMEFGVGEFGNDDFFSLRFNLNLKYAIPISPQAAFFPLFGPSIYYLNFDNDRFRDDDDVDLGVNLGFGFAYQGFTFELAFVAADIPDLTFTFTYTF